MRANGWESRVWVQLTGGQLWEGVPNNNDCRQSETFRVNRALKHCFKSKSQRPRFARSKQERSRRSQALRMVSGFRPQFPALTYLPALTPASPDLRILEAAPDRLTHPPRSSGQPELTSVTSGPLTPGRPPPKEKHSSSF